jgi:hypothetical protein
MTLLAVAESLFVHYFFKTNRPALAVNLDQVLRKAILVGVYPITTLSSILWGLEQYATCPESSLCGATASSSEFAARDKGLQLAAILVAVLGNAWIGYLCVVYLNARMKKLQLNKQRAAIRVMLSLTPTGFSPTEKLDASSPSSSRNNRTLRRSSTTEIRLNDVGAAALQFGTDGVREAFAATGVDQVARVSVLKRFFRRTAKKTPVADVKETDYDAFADAIDETFDYFDLDDNGQVDFREVVDRELKTR